MSGRWWAGVAVGVALALGVVVAMGLGAREAAARGSFALTAEQLRTNQQISIAAVRRSNQSLALLDPIRKLPKLPQKTVGWRSQDLRDGAVTGAKIANGTVSESDLAPTVAGRLPIWAVVNATGSLARSSGGVSSQRTETGLYRVDLNRAVGSCAWTATQVETTAAELGNVGIELDPVDPERLSVRTTNAADAAADRAFSLQVTC
jgi:hypothetical protein